MRKTRAYCSSQSVQEWIADLSEDLSRAIQTAILDAVEPETIEESLAALDGLVAHRDRFAAAARAKRALASLHAVAPRPPRTSALSQCRK